VSQWSGIELDDLVLTGERLTLRPWRGGDASDVEAIMADPAMHEFLPLPNPYTRADADQFVTELGHGGRRDGTGIGNAVVETATGRLVGAAELRLPKPRETFGEIGYWVAVAAQGNGYAAEASRTLATWAFDHGVHRVEIRCAARNVASAKTALAAGFRLEGLMRGRELTPRGPDDGLLFGRLAGDTGEAVPHEDGTVCAETRLALGRSRR
jgi:RimJ/RimL family protein N-acetyltransferase